jgi:hypothetical protein
MRCETNVEEAIVAYFKELVWNSSAETEENHETSIKIEVNPPRFELDTPQTLEALLTSALDGRD